MPRPLRLDAPGAFFHIDSRGVDRNIVFRDATDRLKFLEILSTACERYGGRCHAYCLMDNHYHLLLESIEGRLAALMQYLNGRYGRWFNRRWARSGHLFQGRYHANLIDRDTYFLEVVRYIELNPCRAGLVSDPVQWEWSSLRHRLDPAGAPVCLYSESVLRYFGPSAGAVARYRQFVLDGLGDDSLHDRLRDETILGSEEFLQRHAERARELEASHRVPAHQRLADRPSLGTLLGDAIGTERRRRATEAFLVHGYSMSEIARQLKVHYTTVGRWVRREECDNA